MKISRNPPVDSWPQLITRPQLELDFLDSSVRNVLNRVKKSGDQAIRELTLQFDKVEVIDLKVTDEEFRSAEQALSSYLKYAIRNAAANFEKFHAAQRKETVTI